MQDFFLIISTVYVYCMTLFMSFHPVQLFYAFLHLGSHSLTFSFGFNVYMFYLLLVLLIAFLFYFHLNEQRSVIHVLLCIVSKNGLILLCCSLGIFSYFQRMTVCIGEKKSSSYVPSLSFKTFLYHIHIVIQKNFHTSNSLFKELMHHIVMQAR